MRQAVRVARAVTLTFDNLGEAAEIQRGEAPARPHPSVTEALPFVLDLLGKLGLRATFCVEAVNAREHPGALRAIAGAGHEIALHGWRHERWSELTAAREREIVARAQAAFAALRIHPTGLRPPGGDLAPHGLQVLAEARLRWCSPEGARAYVDAATGLAVVPFRWPLVDATYLHAPFAGLRERLGLPRAPLAPAEAQARLRAELAADPDPVAATLILHPFLAIEPEARAAIQGLLRHLAGERDAGRLRIAPAATIAAELLSSPSGASARPRSRR
jgi:peptidoglycan-N-acetylglucosamine deacetylase